MNNLTVIEHKNQRLLTTQQLADIYETEANILNNNFGRNKNKYMLTKHYFVLEGEELKEFKTIHQFDEQFKHITKLYLWTEKGAWLHAKSLNNDKAWEAYEMLVDTYYEMKNNNFVIPQTLPEALRLAADLAEQNQKLLADNTSMKPKAEFFDAVAGSKDAIEMGAAAKIIYEETKLGRNNLFKKLRKLGILRDNNIPYQEYVDRGYFRVIEQTYNTSDGEVRISKKTLVYQKGLDYIRKALKTNKSA